MGSFHTASLLLLQVVLALHSTILSEAIPFSNLTDLSALLAFKSAVTYDPNNVLANWTTGTNFCTWLGVSCSRRRQRVTALRLPNSGLRGTISPHVGNLSFLSELNLRNNSFRGEALEALTRLPRLVSLSLSRNMLEGEIPKSIQNCPKLQIISLTKNILSGGIPIELTTLPRLNTLFLGTNNLTGTIPPSLANMSSLEWFGIEKNGFHGIIPSEMGNIKKLKGINFWGNSFTGSIPWSIFNTSSLEQVLLSENAFTGELPPTTGLSLPNLEKFNVDVNQFTGRIPVYLSNCSLLDELELSNNQFTGPVPSNLGNLKLLKSFYLAGNELKGSPESSELGFLTDITNCSSLEMLVIDDNPFRAALPDSMGNFSSTLKYFSASRCQMKGQIPQGIGYLKVNFLGLSDNNLLGTIPSTIGRMENLQRLYLNGNRIVGSVPDEICVLRNLGEIDLQNNILSGPIPSCIGNLTRLQKLYLSSNSFTLSIPSSLWSLKNLLFLNLSSNSLSGSLDSTIRPLKALTSMDLSWNRFSGKIPSILGAFQSLIALNLSRNSFWGPIPESFGNLITVDFLDLSHNNLSGSIPKSLEALSHLKFLNLSSNNLSGEIPSQGPFKKLTPDSFLENEALCGQPSLQVPPCTSQKKHQSWGAKRFFTVVAPTTSALVIVFVFLLFLLTKYSRSSVQIQNQVGLFFAGDPRMFSYQELCEATNYFSEENLLGVGSFGSVYKAILSDGEYVAVKVLKLEIEGALKSFYAECKVLGAIRHRNLVKVISACSTPDLRALVLEYMPNGSLEKWLHGEDHCLDLLQRLSIMIDVASALEYLHYGYEEPIVHCDLKPGNVLLDEDLVGHVADFGIAKILAENKNVTQTKTLGTLGYIAPEYGSEGRVSTKGDMYSYGVMLLETFTRKKPMDEMFTKDLSLREWVNESFPENLMDVIDGSLFRTIDVKDTAAIESCLVDIIRLGFECTQKLPADRCGIKDVLLKFDHIKKKIIGLA